MKKHSATTSAMKEGTAENSGKRPVSGSSASSEQETEADCAEWFLWPLTAPVTKRVAPRTRDTAELQQLSVWKCRPSAEPGGREAARRHAPSHGGVGLPRGTGSRSGAHGARGSPGHFYRQTVLLGD